MNLDRMIAVRNDRAVYRDGEDCIKVFCRNYPKEEVFEEAFAGAMAEKVGLPVPKVKGVTSFDGKWAIVSEFIKGKKLSCYMTDMPEDGSHFLKLFVELQRKITQADGTGLVRASDRVRANILRAELDESKKAELCKRLSDMPDENRFCHGDLCPSNVIVSERGLYVIDWHNAASGSVFFDFATAYLHFLLRWNEKHANEYLNLVEPNGRESVLGWIPMVAAAMSVDVNQQDRERLLSIVNAVE